MKKEVTTLQAIGYIAATILIPAILYIDLLLFCAWVG